MKKFYSIFLILCLFTAGIVNAQNLLQNGGFEEGADPIEGWKPLHWDWYDNGGSIWVEVVETGNTSEPIQAAGSQFCYRLMVNPDEAKPGTETGGTVSQTLFDAENYYSGTYQFKIDVNYSGIQRWLNEGQEYVNSASGKITIQIATIDDGVSTLLVDQTITVDSASGTNGWTSHAIEDIAIAYNDSVKVMVKNIKANNLIGTTLFIDNVYFGHPESNVSMQNIFAEKANFLYPNPADGLINITKPSQDIKKISISNLAGKLIYVAETESNSVDISHLPQGLYIVALHSEGRVYYQKLIIK